MVIGILNVVATGLVAAVLVMVEGPRLAHIDDPEVGVWSHSPTITALGTGIEVAVLIILVGGVPGCLLGGLLGLVARQGDDQPPWVRVAVIGVLAEVAVIGLAALTGLFVLVPPAAICTFVASIALERATRVGLSRPV